MTTDEALDKIRSLYALVHTDELDKILAKHANFWYREGYKDAEMTYNSEWP